MSAATALSLPQMRTRRPDLEAELSAAQIGLDAARAGLIDGRVKAGQVVSSQTLVSTLESALASLDAQIAAAEQAEARARAEAAREAALAQLVGVAAEATEHRDSLIDLTRQAVSVLEPVFAEMAQHLDAWGEARAAWVRGATALAPGLKDQGYGYSVAVPGESEQVELLMAYLDAQGSTEAARSRVFSLTPATIKDDPRPLSLPADFLAVPLFGLFKRHYVRATQRHLDI